MTPQAMLVTALMLGAFVAAAGAYGILYCAARLWRRPMLKTASEASCAAMVAIAAAVVALTPLHEGWKTLIAASCAAYVAIPPVTWRYLTRLHRAAEGASHDARPA
jgi:hypothetical protein